MSIRFSAMIPIQKIIKRASAGISEHTDPGFIFDDVLRAVGRHSSHPFTPKVPPVEPMMASLRQIDPTYTPGDQFIKAVRYRYPAVRRDIQEVHILTGKERDTMIAGLKQAYVNAWPSIWDDTSSETGLDTSGFKYKIVEKMATAQNELIDRMKADPKTHLLLPHQLNYTNDLLSPTIDPIT